MRIRKAVLNDVNSLILVENSCFETDKLSARSFRRFLKQPKDIVLIAEADDGKTLGYGLLLRRRGTPLARLYSLAVLPDTRGQGIGRALLVALEEAAITEDCRFIRLEVSTENTGALALYQAMGYRRMKFLEGYYDDGQDALQMEKRLSLPQQPPVSPPFYPQSTPFTCGPAALMMAMHAQTQSTDQCCPLSREMEIQLWREATTIYMTTGLGGTSPFGLAAAAARRGFETKVVASHLDAPFLDSVRSPHKRELMTHVHDQFLKACKDVKVTLSAKELQSTDLSRMISKGWGVLLLISTWRLNRNKAPHWVWLVNIDKKFAYLNDPDVDIDQHDHAMDNQYMPVSVSDLNAMMRYGKARYRAAIFLKKKNN